MILLTQPQVEKLNQRNIDLVPLILILENYNYWKNKKFMINITILIIM